MNTENNIENEKSRQRVILSVVIASISLIGLGLISWYVLKYPSTSDPISHETIFTTIVSLVGTWIGTLLAFYFSRDSYDSASRNTRELVRQVTTTQQKLRSIKAEDKMYNLSEFSYLKLKETEEGSTILENLLKDEKYLSKYNRLPIFTEDMRPKYMVHESLINKFLVQKETFTPPAGDPAPSTGFTLKDLVNDSNFSKQAKESFATIKPEDTLETAKLLMEKKTTSEVICSDVFVTEDGKPNGQVLGWITNVLINENSTVD